VVEDDRVVKHWMITMYKRIELELCGSFGRFYAGYQKSKDQGSSDGSD